MAVPNRDECHMTVKIWVTYLIYYMPYDLQCYLHLKQLNNTDDLFSIMPWFSQVINGKY